MQDAVVGLLGRRALLLPRDAGAIYSYLRASIRNRITDELRKAATESKHLRSCLGAASPAASPLDEALLRDERLAFNEALLVLEERERLLVTGRVELGFSYLELAAALGYGSPDAARMATKRAVLRIGRLMQAARPKREAEALSMGPRAPASLP